MLTTLADFLQEINILQFPYTLSVVHSFPIYFSFSILPHVWYLHDTRDTVVLNRFMMANCTALKYVSY